MNEFVKFIGFAGGAFIGFYAMNRVITRYLDKR
jgi:hypothetical protein